VPTETPISCACTTVKRVSRSLGRAYDQALAVTGLNVTQLAVMRAVERRSGEPMVRVAEDLSMDRTSLYRSLSPLQREGWVEVHDGPGRRSRSAATTPRGEKVLAEAEPVWEAMQIAIIERFGQSAWRDLVDDLHRLEASIPDRVPDVVIP